MNSGMIQPDQGEIWLVDFDPKYGREIGKERPAVVVNADYVGRLPIRIVVPITKYQASRSSYPWMIDLHPGKQNGLRMHSHADCFQVKSLSTEIERSGNFDRILQAAKRLKASRKNQHVLKVPHKDMPKARKALRQLGISGTVKNMGETSVSHISRKKR